VKQKLVMYYMSVMLFWLIGFNNNKEHKHTVMKIYESKY